MLFYGLSKVKLTRRKKSIVQNQLKSYVEILNLIKYNWLSRPNQSLSKKKQPLKTNLNIQQSTIR